MPQPERKTGFKIPMGIGHIQAKKMYEYIIRHSGGTFTALGTPLRLQHGFVLSVDPGWSKTVPLREFSPTTLTVFAMNAENFILDYNTQEPMPMHGFKMLGAWVVGDMVHLDVVTVIATKDVDYVIDLARQNGQKAVWDFSTQQAIDVEKYAGQLV